MKIMDMIQYQLGRDAIKTLLIKRFFFAFALTGIAIATQLF